MAILILVQTRDRALTAKDKYIREEYKHNFELNRERAKPLQYSAQ